MKRVPTFNGSRIQFWDDAQYERFYADPEHNIPIEILCHSNNALILCDQLQDMPEAWKGRIADLAMNIALHNLELKAVKKGLKRDQVQMAKIKAKFYTNCVELFEVCDEVRDRFDVPITDFVTLENSADSSASKS